MGFSKRQLWPSLLNKTCHFTKLPTDVLIDNVCMHLDAEDVIRLRMVNKFFLVLTEHPSIWKRLLRRTTFPLPPLPPTSRYAMEKLTGLEAERLVTRAISLDKIWREEEPTHVDHWRVNTQYFINSMVLLPGGRYLVASAKDNTHDGYLIVVYVLDHHYRAVPLAVLPTKKVKAYQLVARYVSVDRPGGSEGSKVTGIAISYVITRPRHRADYRKMQHEYSAGYDMDIDVELVHECFCVHISLDDLEVLGANKLEPGSRKYIKLAGRKESPFCELVHLRSRSPFGTITLSEVYGIPYLAVVKPGNKIVFQQLVPNTGTAMLICNPFVPNREHKIQCIRILPEQHQVLVVRRIEVEPGQDGRAVTSIELHDIPLNLTDEPIEVSSTADMDNVLGNDLHDLLDVQIPEFDIPLWDDRSFRGEMDPMMYRDRQLTIYARTVNPHGVLRMSIKPEKVERPSTDPIAKRLPYITHYKLPNLAKVRTLEAVEGEVFGILAGAYRSVVFTTSLFDICLCPQLRWVYRYSDDEEHPAPEQMQHAKKTYPEGLSTLRALLPGSGGARIAAMAWDETTGRLLNIAEGSKELHVMDFARAPRTDTEGRRYPLCLPLDLSLAENYPDSDDDIESIDAPPDINRIQLRSEVVHQATFGSPVQKTEDLIHQWRQSIGPDGDDPEEVAIAIKEEPLDVVLD
ncbi:hypothetical protein EIP91_010252 [Steccherinum ochraceum]|uniref:F-box domain-containing protein n=1 Tax=Steccherinum ochraceum TaxID=92696 RepID=A0A4R0R0T4_9APHY|nr:hypothetical protein EIP91_010252 [Steccherinum ochraceum]